MSGPLEWTAFIIALVALVVSTMQVALEYISTAEERRKVNAAAIGEWAKRNKTRWNMKEFKFRVKYTRPSFTMDEAINQLRAHEQSLQRLKEILKDYVLIEHVQISDGPYGPRVSGRPELLIYARGSEDQTPVPFSSLPKNQRHAAEILQDDVIASYKLSTPHKATWCTLMSDVGLDLASFPSDDFLDADAIQSTLDAPTMQIRLSDLICAGFVMDMKFVEDAADPKFPGASFTMIGKWCNITTQYQSGVGLLARYSGLAHQVLPICRSSTVPELVTLQRTAQGVLCIGDSRIQMQDLGYNTVDMVFNDAMEKKVQGEEAWQQIDVSSVLRAAEDDEHLQWGGKWSHPKTPPVAFLLAICANMAVANAFPHQFLSAWTPEQRKVASRSAFDFLDKGEHFVVAPRLILTQLKGSDLVIRDDYKPANGYGCELGGLRGWLSSNLAEFTFRMSKCWTVEGLTDKVPLLPQLYPNLREGSLDRKWAESYNLKPVEGFPARVLLWLQIMMLDTCIARRVDVIMTGNGMGEVSVPANQTNASLCAQEASKIVPQSTGWKPVRIQFAKFYLAQLAEGEDGKGVSCMSPDHKADLERGWKHVPHGKPHDWATLDAILTLRATIMATQLEVMKDSSILLQLQKSDPMVLLA